jgi:hypothetical protein
VIKAVYGSECMVDVLSDVCATNSLQATRGCSCGAGAGRRGGGLACGAYGSERRENRWSRITLAQACAAVVFYSTLAAGVSQHRSATQGSWERQLTCEAEQVLEINDDTVGGDTVRCGSACYHGGHGAPACPEAYGHGGEAWHTGGVIKRFTGYTYTYLSLYIYIYI